MAKDNHEKLYGILLDVQKQLGQLGNETSKQSEMLISLNEKVAIANGRTSKIEKKVEDHEAIINNWKGRIAIIVIIGGFMVNLFVGWLKKQLDL